MQSILVLLAVVGLSSFAHAETAPSSDDQFQSRFSLNGGVGVTQLAGTSQANLSAGLEFEYQFRPHWGWGAFGNYIFSSPSVGQIGAPQVYFYPLANRWYINAAPFLQMSAGNHQIGFRLGTRIPLNFGIIQIVPQVAVDFVGGGRNLMFALGVGVLN